MEAIFKRRSVRKYTEEIVSEDLIEQILRAGMAAPSAANEQPWQFIVVDDKDLLNEISNIHGHAQMLKEASHAIVICSDKAYQKLEGFWVQDCAAATQNMLLMAQHLGLGSVWLGVYPMEKTMAGLKQLLNLPEGVTPVTMIALGYPAETKEPEDRFNPLRIHRNKW